MKPIILSLLCFIGIAVNKTVAQVSTECIQSIKTGNFTHTDENGITTIERTKKLQTEHQPANGGTIVSKISWLSDDEYELTIKKLIGVGPSVLKKGSKIRVKITACTETSYTCIVIFGSMVMEGVEYTIQ